ncbi:heterokaryon incompatibility protein [Diaporthe helianthi]|uniref:Heterokaryon incompatibility protein n=1 Tax=Diaporthe helianthi TaxID=158607 RepID=A0A2P5HRT5_DIAHE|nr:heterokaryon incompatibility protein [Diaporthe helianthi]
MILWNGMSVWHRQSFRMLFDWWTASYQDSPCSLASILALVDQGQDIEFSELQPHGSKQKAETIILELLKLKRWPEGDIETPPRLPGPRAVLTGYNDHLKELFLCEFNTINDSDDDRQKSFSAHRRWSRSRAARSSFSQQTAWKLLDRHQATETQPQVSNSVSKLGSFEDFERKFGTEKHNQTDLFVKGPIIEPCPWLPSVAHDGLPHYLWDVKHATTVETSTLLSFPEYAAISHLWGRWATGEAVNVKGITGWKVPSNTRFRVEDIPEILHKVPSKTPYIWFDLCCIPQEPGSSIGAREIARQAQIFRNAKIVVAWLNEVDDFQGLSAILKWKAVQLLRFRPGRNLTSQDALVAKLWGSFAGKQTGLLIPRSGPL